VGTLARVDLGRIGYAEAWDLQRRLVAERREGGGEDQLLLCEHDEVVTTGRRAQGPTRDESETAGVRAAGIEVVAIERGGAATYHGPGQLVGYPLVLLAPGERDLHRFLRHLEGALIVGLSESCGLSAERREGFTGVWVGERKLASIGIACRGWVTYHGFALNLSTDLSRFALFRPCDLDAQVMTSLAQLDVDYEREALGAAIHAALAERLSRQPA
jgi:lipoate-protein ligase B